MEAIEKARSFETRYYFIVYREEIQEKKEETMNAGEKWKWGGREQTVDTTPSEGSPEFSEIAKVGALTTERAGRLSIPTNLFVRQT